eukprot:gnl/MRDRNA2_/MRDRNA2_102719_c0_seq1.p1 gnl/MRDRNA2_/MRDRNA2_102719_c0~~gnl/MRDRNA2_/MRDRNA2_102719_c0_seq1.p1  ORF type:complete len:251 (-),score=40.47 gnl/MRDRNA2_/MRDRNA2_102719_c0_seq1:5-757(-)
MVNMQLQQRSLFVFVFLASMSTTLATPSPTVELNRFTFEQNVLTSGNRNVEHWIVRFCHSWYGPCEKIAKPYQQLAAEFTGKLSSTSTMVRFADVDCSVDKALCNEQGIERFPKVVHYSGQKQVAHWFGKHGDAEADARRLNQWLRKRFVVEAESQAPAKGSQTQSKTVKSGARKRHNWQSISVMIPDWAPVQPYLLFQEIKAMVVHNAGAAAKASITIGIAVTIICIVNVINKEFTSILKGSQESCNSH